MRARAEVHQVKSPATPSTARVLRHRRHDDAVLQRDAAHVNGVNIGGIGGLPARRPAAERVREPALRSRRA